MKGSHSVKTYFRTLVAVQASKKQNYRAWLSCSCTALLSPPQSASPNVTTEPSPRMAANARLDAWICRTFPSSSCAALLSPPSLAASVPPSHHGTIGKDGSKRAQSGLDLPHVSKLVLHVTAVSAISSVPPGHDGAIAQDGSKCAGGGLDLLHVPQLALHSTAVSAISSVPPGHH